jgi:hypothetical protein
MCRGCSGREPARYDTVAHAASTATTARIAAIAIDRRDRLRRAVAGMDEETDVSPLLWLA